MSVKPFNFGKTIWAVLHGFLSPLDGAVGTSAIAMTVFYFYNN